ncbi:MAG: hypothetical protein V1892_03490 [bacterium]
MTKQKVAEKIAEICQERKIKKPFLKVNTKKDGSFYGRFSEINKVNGLGLKVSGGTQFIDFSSIESIEYCSPRDLKKKLLAIDINIADCRNRGGSLYEISKTLNDISRILQATYY